MLKSENTILKGKILPPLIKFTLPLALAILIQALYGAVDLIVVGKFGNTASVAAVSNGSQIMNLITTTVTSFSVGVTVTVGNFVGAKNDKSAAQTVGGMVKLFSIIAVVLTAIVLIFSRQIVAIMQVPAEAVEGTLTYLRVCGSGTIFIVAFNAISALFRGVGDSKSPLIFVGVACVVNIVLDLVLVGIFDLDVFGAAFATIFAQACSVLFSLMRMKKGILPFKLSRENFLSSGNTMVRIFKIGLPVAVQQFLVCISFLIITAIVNSISLVASAAIGISEKIFLFLGIIPLAFMSSLSAFVAQNIGAQQEDRALQSVKAALPISFVCGVLMSLVAYFAGDILASVFENNPEVIAATHDYLRATSLEYTMLSVVFCLLGYFNGIGKTTFTMIEGVFTAFLVRIPLSYYFSTLPNTNLFTIGLAVPISVIVALFMCVIYYYMLKRKRRI